MEENRILIVEAMARAKEKGLKMTQQEIAKAIWTESAQTAANMNMHNLKKGKTTKVDRKTIARICKLLKCDANYLFNIKK